MGMKTFMLGWLCVAAMLAGAMGPVRADEFSEIAKSPYTYWVPAPPGYVAGPPTYYYPAAPPVRIYVGGPHFFFGFHFH